MTAKKKKLTTLLVFVQDETGSMQGRRDATISAFNEYFAGLRAAAKEFGKVTVHAWQFSEAMGENRVRPLHQGTLAKTPKLSEKNYRPRGVTPLLDAVGTAIQQASAVEVDRYLFVVQTDGVENASRDFTHDQVQALFAEKEKLDNWSVVFLGAGMQGWARSAAFAVMGATGASGSVGYSGDPGATSNTYASLGTHTTNLLRSTATSAPLGVQIQKDVDGTSEATPNRPT